MLRNWLKNIIYAGWVNEDSADIRKQILISSLFSLISFVFLIFYGCENIIEGNLQLATVVLVAAAASGINYVILYKTGKSGVTSLIILMVMTALCFYLVSTGGSSNTGPLWLFVLPCLVFYILGLYKGTVYLLVLLLIIFYIFLVPGNSLLLTEYSPTFTSRFIGSFLSLSILAFIYEYSREDGRRELMNLSYKLDYLSRKDYLTGLSNRRDMFERLRTELSRLERSGRIFSVLIADIDNFKSINDNYGHECGDHCLKIIAGALSTNTQKRDIVARWGGEEFLVFLPETTGEQAKVIGERLRAAIEQLVINFAENTIHITTSIGVAEYVPGQTLNALINNADRQLYLAKNRGRNRVEKAGPEQQMHPRIAKASS